MSSYGRCKEQVLQRPVEPSQFTSRDFRKHLSARGITHRRGG
ncbi:MAG: hypothetical protein JWP95_1860, partial [Actinotalea sp.]|nr:hypothetical protein [Actinotalea sp.]